MTVAAVRRVLRKIKKGRDDRYLFPSFSELDQVPDSHFFLDLSVSNCNPFRLCLLRHQFTPNSSFSHVVLTTSLLLFVTKNDFLIRQLFLTHDNLLSVSKLVKMIQNVLTDLIHSNYIVEHTFE